MKGSRASQSDPSTRSEQQQALDRAREHLRQSLLEGLEGASALFEAALRASDLFPPAQSSRAAEAERQLDLLIDRIRQNEAFRIPTVLAQPLSDALQHEIERWESRSRTDPDARPVLRAFLALRELLWEFGVRAEPEPESARDSAEAKAPPKESIRKPARVQRFEVES